ncbi:GPI transamidase component PIG-S [Zalerion maritima]|uniref:GPI transamidase component PIG-S n=1 Tax=Zalerion maritima TaxID=339359 RepID=A0AAD5RKK1_9PEZI|nr:GPI transamidase component PIG-S [Zalerion maritima]
MSSDAPPSTAVSAAPSRKEPPPEEPHDVRRRSYVILSFWLIVLLLGLPIWWHTTAIYRASLPLDEMGEWADWKACRPVFPLRIAVQASTMQDGEGQNLVKLTQHALDDLNDFSWHHLRLDLIPPVPVEPHAAEADVALTIRLIPGEPMEATLHPHLPILDIKYPPNSPPTPSSSSSPLATFIARELRSKFAEERAIISALLSKELRPARSMQYSPTYHLTFSLFTSGSTPNTWEIENAISEYMRPVLDILRPIHNFTIDTQVQLYATPGVQSQSLEKEDLASFINAAEWPLSPSIAGAPTINFVVYIGNQTIGTSSKSWMIPQWGSVYLLDSQENPVGVDELKQPLLTFTSHLLSLLGTPESGSLPLKLSTLSRVRSADLLLRASSTLGSLARLSLALPSISIPSSVADGVSKTMKELELACQNLGNVQGLEHARIAEQEAEKAFFEKSMVGQLYFPDEHKIAVYLPLLGPVGVPLIIGLINELKLWRKARKG